MASLRRALPFVLAVGLLPASLLTVSCSGDDEQPQPSSGSGTGGGTSTGTGSVGGTGGTGGEGAGGVGGAGGTGGIATEADCSDPTGELPALKLTEVASGFNLPVLVKSAPGDATRLYVVEKLGVIRLIKDGETQATPFLDIQSIVQSGGVNDERGLIGLAFHPDYAQNGRFFVHHTKINAGNAGEIIELKRSSNADVAEPTPVGVVYTSIAQATNHNGGSIEFSPLDGFLYISLGDGGGSGDPNDNGQTVTTPLGAMLRLDVSTLPGTPPAGNFGGAALPEIWSIGLRNAYRTSFDACTGDFYVADVGQNVWEEINVEPAGAGGRNYGWRLKEGLVCYNPGSDCDPGGLTDPVAVYPHGASGGCSVTGGYVYRGSAIPALRGTYLYGDYCTGNTWGLVWKNGALVSQPVSLTSALGSGGTPISSFGQDNQGEVYIVDYSGRILRIDPA